MQSPGRASSMVAVQSGVARVAPPRIYVSGAARARGGAAWDYVCVGGGGDNLICLSCQPRRDRTNDPGPSSTENCCTENCRSEGVFACFC